MPIIPSNMDRFKSVVASCTLRANTLLKDEESARNNHVKKFTNRLSNKPFLLWLLTTPPHLKHVATLPSNLLLMARFADINV